MTGLRVGLVWVLILFGMSFGPRHVFAIHAAVAQSQSQDSQSATPTQRSSSPAEKSEPNHVALEGHVVCLDGHGQPIPADKECSEPLQLTLHTADGLTHSFVSNDALAAMLADTRVRQRTLRITALRHADGQLETLTVQSSKNGKLYDIYYYCQVCNITTYTPGPCPCCRRELEFKEAPASEP